MMRKSKSSISLITATYNASTHLPHLISSLRAQTDHDFEWFVLDGGSSDDTTTQLAMAGDILTFWKSEPDFGIYDALNTALSMVKSDYYLVLGADDLLDFRAIELYRHAIDISNADVISGAVMVDGIKVVAPAKPVWWRSSPLFVSAHSVGALIRTELHRELGVYSRRFPIAADTYFLLHVWNSGKRIHSIEDIVGTFGSSGVSGTDTLGSLCEAFRVNVEVRGNLFTQVVLLVLKILKNSTRISRELNRCRR